VKRNGDKDPAETWASVEIDQLASEASEIMSDAESLVQFLHNWVLKLNLMSLEETERGRELRKIASSMWRWPVVASVSNRDEWAADKSKKDSKSALMDHLEKIGVGKSTGRSGSNAKYSFGNKDDPTTIARKIWRILDVAQRSKRHPDHCWEKLARDLSPLQKDGRGRGEGVNKEWVRAADEWLKWKLGPDWPRHHLINGWRRRIYQDHKDDFSLKEPTDYLRAKLLRSLQRGFSSIAKKS
jgi:hypothetical protein